MSRALRATAIPLLAAALVSTSLATPAAAVVDEADYVIWRFTPAGARGLGMIHESGSASSLIAETVGLNAGSSYRYVGSTARCAETHAAANVLWSRSFQSNGNGAAFTNTGLDDAALSPNLRSIRLLQGGKQIDCAKPLAYQSDSGRGPVDAVSTLSPYQARLMVFVDLASGNDRLTAVGHGFIASHGYRLIGASVSCPNHPTAATTLFRKIGETNARGVLWRHDTLSDIGNAPPKSIQLFSPSGRVACATPTRLPPVQ